MAGLVELDMLDFDVILGVNLIHACYASIDCSTCVLKFQIHYEPFMDGVEVQLYLRVVSFRTLKREI